VRGGEHPERQRRGRRSPSPSASFQYPLGLEANPNASGGWKMSYRVELDLTQTQLAEKINAKQKSISRYETGASLPSIETLVKIVKVLKKPAGYFLEK